MAEPILETRGLRKRFGGLLAVDGVSIAVQAGEIHALIGPNGAGKTTLINLIAGTLRPDAGAVLLGGHDATRWSAPHRAQAGLARTFQITSVIPGFTALDNAALAAQARAGLSFRVVGRASKDRTLNQAGLAALAQVGLDHRAGALAGTLSHGEKRQLELAIALAAEPRLLVLDEPLAGAGPEETARLVSLLDGLRARFGMLLVEHDMHAVFALADRITVLVDGRAIITGSAAVVRAHPVVRDAYLGQDDIA